MKLELNILYFVDRASQYMYVCNETDLMHYLSSVYSVTIPLHVSGLLVAHHQVVTMYISNKWYVLYVLVDCQLAWLLWDQSHPEIVLRNRMQLFLRKLYVTLFSFT
jgi:hypothetical protein